MPVELKIFWNISITCFSHLFVIFTAESPVRNQKSNNNQDEMVNFDELKNRIYETLQSHTEGLLLQDLPVEYEVIDS